MGMLSQQNNGDKDKPLFRKWYKQAKKEGVKDLSQPIEKIRLSSSEEWIIIECTDSVSLLNAESKIGSSFWKNLQEFKDKAVGLKVVFATGKLGFDIEFTDKQVYYIWEDDVLFLSRTKKLPGDSTSSNLGSIDWKTAQALSGKPSLEQSETGLTKTET